jgi:hypothetical protein
MAAADVLSILPFGNLVTVVALTSEQLYDSLENWVSGLSSYTSPGGVFPQARPSYLIRSCYYGHFCVSALSTAPLATLEYGSYV